MFLAIFLASIVTLIVYILAIVRNQPKKLRRALKAGFMTFWMTLLGVIAANVIILTT